MPVTNELPALTRNSEARATSSAFHSCGQPLLLDAAHRMRESKAWAWWKAIIGPAPGQAYNYAMIAFYNLPPTSLGLGGDGDEIAAIGEVERQFNVQLDYSEARDWKTVGDVYEALKCVLPSDQISSEKTWPIFVQAICEETGVDPWRVNAKTLLLGKKEFDWRIALFLWSLVGLLFASMWFG